jgi:hypothetical protein
MPRSGSLRCSFIRCEHTQFLRTFLSLILFNRKGDYHKYLAEFASGDKRKDAASQAHEAYVKANEIAQSDLDPTNPIRLGLGLNFSVFYYEILNLPERACHIAKQAFDEAIEGNFWPSSLKTKLRKIANLCRS